MESTKLQSISEQPELYTEQAYEQMESMMSNCFIVFDPLMQKSREDMVKLIDSDMEAAYCVQMFICNTCYYVKDANEEMLDFVSLKGVCDYLKGLTGKTKLSYMKQLSGKIIDLCLNPQPINENPLLMEIWCSMLQSALQKQYNSIPDNGKNLDEIQELISEFQSKMSVTELVELYKDNNKQMFVDENDELNKSFSMSEEGKLQTKAHDIVFTGPHENPQITTRLIDVDI